jgi:hypothetical protein
MNVTTALKPPGIADLANVYQDATDRAAGHDCSARCSHSCHVNPGRPSCDECQEILEEDTSDAAMDLAGVIAADGLLWQFCIRARGLRVVAAQHIQPLAGA